MSDNEHVPPTLTLRWRRYMVLGMYEDGQRFADTAEAPDGESAEALVLERFRADNPHSETPDLCGSVFVNDNGDMEMGS